MACCWTLVTCLIVTFTFGECCLNRTDSAGVQYLDASCWFHQEHFRPWLERLDPAFKIWFCGVIDDELAVTQGFTKILDERLRFKLLRKLVRFRLLRWIVALLALKLALAFFVVVILPNIYFMAMMMTD